MKTAIGFRVHSGWACMVIVAGTPQSPSILDRRRIEIMDHKIPGSKQPFHYAAGLGLAKAQAHLDKCAAQSRKLAQAAIADAIQKHHPVVCGIGISSARPMGTLEATLASHAAIHSAEGQFFRDAIEHAAESCKLPCRKFKEKELVATAEAGFSIRGLERCLTEMKKNIGAPWTQDEKFAALAAWIALKS